MPAEPASSAPPAAVRTAGRGEAARRRILAAATQAFGARGFSGATTREIAAAAGVNLPALKYYFGGKDGLYLACAAAIAEGYAARMTPTVAAAVAALGDSLSAADARGHLKAIIGALAERLITDPEAEVWTAFAVREMADQGPAFDLLYDQVWAPGVELAAQLVGRARGAAAPQEADRIQALMLISGLMAFSIARPVALRAMAWGAVDAEGLATIRRQIHDQIDRIGA